MVDNVNPNSQFHPYQPVNDTPAVDRMKPSGLDLGGMRDTLNGSLGKVRDYAKTNPGVVLGGLAALAIGAGLMRRR
jgi:hypothetical protein